MSWTELKDKLLKTISEVENEKFDGVAELKNSFIEYFEKKTHTKDEVEEAKILVKKLSTEIEKKIQSYSKDLNSNIENMKNFNTYMKNIKTIDLA